MKIALYGATGMIGRRILTEALNRGHEVTALVRTPEALDVEPRLRVVAGDALDSDNVAHAVAGHDIVISAYGPRYASPDLIVLATRALVEGAERAHVHRLLVVNGAGSLEAAPGKRLMDLPEFPEAWKPAALAHAKALELLRLSGLDWTALSPAAKTAPGHRTGKFRLGQDRLVVDEQGRSEISAEDCAVALLDEAESGNHLRQRFTIGY